MLNLELIKEGCKFADGFEIKNDKHSDDNDSLVHIDEGLPLRFLTRKNVQNSKRWKDSIYPLFLQRVIEGINSSRHADDWLILTPTNSCFMCINNSDQNKVKSFYFDREKHIIDQAKEEAIRYILGKL